MDKKAQYNMMEDNVTELKADVGKWKSIANRKVLVVAAAIMILT